MDGTRGNGLVNVSGNFGTDDGQLMVDGPPAPLLLEAGVSRHCGVECPKCHTRHDIVPNVVLATVNPSRIPCQHCDGIIEVRWR